MRATDSFRLSSITKKFLMAFSGLILVGFVFVHMLGNLNMFKGPDAMNAYAHFLQTLPFNLLWANRLMLLGAVFIHVWMAILLTLENRRAHPTNYAINARKKVGSSLASKTMGVSGSVILLFIFFHLGDFTLRIIFPEYQTDQFYTQLNTLERGEKNWEYTHSSSIVALGEQAVKPRSVHMVRGEAESRSSTTSKLEMRSVYNVYAMVIASFSRVWVSLFYIVAMAFLCMHLSHGVSSMFQTVGLRNGKWKKCIDNFAIAYSWIVFLGFISVPLCVLLSKFKIIHIFPDLSALLANI